MSIRKAVKNAKRILGKDRHMVDFMQYIVFYRTHRTDVVNRAQYHIIPTLRTLARKRGLSYQRALYCTIEELFGVLPPKTEIKERMIDCAIVMEKRNIRCVVGSELEKLRELVREDAVGCSEFSGTIACKGIVRGTARIIFRTEDFGKVRVGDILVTPMTNPHMIPIMKKAAAFVTDEGGITCHAAIIAREMKKPCVIGTKIATKIFKDGDRVEVDADSGVVRKI